MKCVNCGNEMEDTEKWCYSCGALNPTLSENAIFLEKNPVKYQSEVGPQKKERKDNSTIFLFIIALALGAVIAYMFM